MRARAFGAVVAISLFATVSSATAAVNLIQNGSFEAGTYIDDGPGFQNLSAGDPSITNWTIGGHSIDWIGSYWQPGDGIHSLDLSGLALGSVSQSFATVAGGTYQVSFLMSGNPDGGPNPKTLDVNVAGGDFFFNPASGPNHANMNWTPGSFFFVANSPTTTITFASTTCADGGNFPCAFGPALDNVSVSAVPEASTWLMMLLGFAGIGFAAYRRSRRNEKVSASA